MKVRTGWLIVWYNGAFHSSSRQTRFCIEPSGGTADSHWRRRCSSKPLHLLSRSLVTIHLCWFWTRQTFEKQKHHSLPSVRLIHSPSVCVDFPYTLPHTVNIMQMKNVKARPPGWTMHGQRKISPVCINEAQCPAQVSPPLHGQARGWLWGSAACSAHSGSPQGNLHQDNQFCRCKGSKSEKPKHFPPWIQLCGKIWLETPERSSRGPWTLLPNDLASSLICSSVICQKWTPRNGHTFCTCTSITIFLLFVRRPKPFLYYVFM